MKYKNLPFLPELSETCVDLSNSKLEWRVKEIKNM